MKELQERIEECLVRLKELPALIRAEREKMNGKAAIEELKTRLKGLWLDFIADATEAMSDECECAEGEKPYRLYTNAPAREGYALKTSKLDVNYQHISEEIKRFEHQRSTATMNHESLCKEHSGLISAVDVLREMLKVAHYNEMVKINSQAEIDRLGVSIEDATSQVEILKDQQVQLVTIRRMNNKEQEASNEEG